MLVALGLIGWVLVSAVSDPRLGRVAVGLAATVAIVGGVIAGLRGGPARGWWWASGAIALWTVGDMIWWADSAADQAPGIVATVGLFGYAGPVLVAAWVLDGAAERPMTFIRQVLDGLIVGGSVLFAAWVLLMHLAGGRTGSEQGRRAALLTQTALAAALATTLVMIGLTYAERARRPWLLAAGGLGLLALTSAVALTNPATWPLAAGSVAALLLLAAATWRDPGPQGRRPRAVLTPAQELIPNAAVVVILVAAVVGDIVRRPPLIVATLVLLSMVAGRRLLISQEKHAHATTLDRDLTRSMAELDDVQSLLQRAFEDSLTGGLWTSIDGRIHRANPAYCRMLGRPESDLVGTRLPTWVDPASAARAEEMFTRVGTIDGAGLPVELRYRKPDGKPLWAQHTAAVFRTVEGAPIQMGVQVIDVTEARMAARRQAHQARFLDAILENIGSAVVACDAQGQVNLINLCTREMFNLPPAPWMPPPGIEQPPVYHADGITPIPPDERPLSRSLRGELVRDVETVFGEPGADRRIVLSSAHRLQDEDGAVLGAVLVMHDVTERRRVESALIRQALHDPLTDLANRALLGDRLDQAIARQQRQPEPFALLLLDLDGFKLVNDSLGHQAGDQVLITVATRLRSSLRAEDTVARLGGDEFAVLLERTCDSQALAIAEQLLGVLRRPVQVHAHTITPDASVGVALSTGDDTAESMLRNADLAMYAAKDAGKGVVQVYRASMHESVLQRLIMDAELRLAIDEQQFSVHYQPIISLISGQLRGFEALLRWQHPVRGDIPPSSFIPLAESSGLIVPLGGWVLREACTQAARWRRLFPPTRSLTMSVNLSVRQIQEPTLVATVLEALTDAGLEPGDLQLEITESTLDQRNLILGVLHELHDKGIKLAIDDFGTGYSSLSRLHTLPVDRVKIDRSFIELLAGSNPAPLVAATVAMAHSLGMQTTAEGIESADQLPMLRMYGCDDGQGYYFGRPMSAEAATALIHTQLRRESADPWPPAAR